MVMLRVHHEVVDSTNVVAKALSREHPGRAILVSAATQTAGRGRLGRSWQSPMGGAWFSLAWPCGRGIEHYQGVSLAVGLAVLRVVEEHYASVRGLEIKWPNDLLHEGRKVAGMLCEWEGGASALSASSATLIVGVGLNLSIDVAALPTELRGRAGSLLGPGIAAEEIAAWIDACGMRLAEELACFEREGLDERRRTAIDARLAWRGRDVAVRDGGRLAVGCLRGIDMAGRIELETATGVQRLEGGELSLRSIGAVQA
jgi:BirA family transcriptional regulator, biotin operon repressor / biotin---[acetyl-CoA-carboxylase] ligase